jgi:hypothetical protein
MTSGEYPNEITKDNLPKLVEKAKETKKKADKVIYSSVIVYSVVAIITLFRGLPLWGFFVISTSPPMSPETAIVTILVSFLIFYQMFVLVLLLYIELGMKRVFHLKYEEWVFGECILTINYIRNNDKIKAIAEVDNLASSIRGLLWDSRRNSRSKMLSPELRTLENGAKSIKRMLLFSTKDTVGMFACFAFAFIHNQDATTFSALKNLIDEASLFGEMKGLTQRVLGRLERYPSVVAIIWAVASTVISIVLAILLKINIQ